MRQLLAFMEAIRVRNTTRDYHDKAFHAALGGIKDFPSLDDLLGLPLDEQSTFDERTDQIMSKRAEAILAERRALLNV